MNLRQVAPCAAIAVLLAGCSASGTMVPNDTWPQAQFNAAREAVFDLPDWDVQWKSWIGQRTNGGLAIVGQTVFVSSFDQSLYAFDAVTGKTLWRAPVANVTMSPPIITQGVAIVGTGTGVIEANQDTAGLVVGRDGGDEVDGIDVKTGKALWHFKTAGEDMPGGVLVNDAGRALFVFANGDQHVYALDPRTGELVWRRSVPGADFMTSLATEDAVIYGTTGYTWDYYYRGWIRGDAAILRNIDHTWALKPDGTFLWRSLSGQPTNTLAYSDKLVLAESIGESGRGYGSHESVTQMVTHQFDEVQGIDATTGRVLWRFYGGSGGQTHQGSNIEAAGGLVIGSTLYQALPLSKTFVALSAQTGRLQWTFKTKAPVKMSPVYYDGKVYFGDASGVMYVVRASNGRVVARSKLPEAFGASPPVIVGKTMFVANGKHLYALRIANIESRGFRVP